MPDPTEATALVVSRLRSADDLTASLRRMRALLIAAEGCVAVDLARNVDEPDLWMLAGRWRDIGSWRRALSSYDVKVAWLELMPLVVDEPSTYELGSETDAWNDNVPR